MTEPDKQLPAETEPAKNERPFIDPGWYRDLSNEDYHGSFGFSSSQIKTLLEQTPAHLKHKMVHPKDQTDNMLLGTVLHTLVLEPDHFAAEFVVAPEINKRTKAGKAEWEEFSAIAAEAGQQVITAAMLGKAMAMRESVLAQPMAAALLADTTNESSIYWWYNSMDPDDSDRYKIMCKVRPDSLGVAHPVVMDLKSCADASYSGFQRAILNFGYHVSAAMYLEGVNQCDELLSEIGHFAYTKFVFICAESEPPYLPAVYELSPEFLELGKQQYRRGIRILKHGIEQDWPGFASEVRTIEPPGWANRLFIV